jgi:hypothetical protein
VLESAPSARAEVAGLEPLSLLEARVQAITPSPATIGSAGDDASPVTKVSPAGASAAAVRLRAKSTSASHMSNPIQLR